MRTSTVSELQELAARQRQIITRAQLGTLGCTARDIGRLLTDGHLHRALPGVYLYGTAQCSHDALLQAALLHAGDGAMLSHRTAAEIRGTLRTEVGVAHVTTPRDARVGRLHPELPMREPSSDQPHGLICVHGASPPMPKTETADGWPVTTVPRTLVDVARLHGPVVLGWCWDEAEYRSLLDPVAIESELAARRAPGNRHVRKLLAESYPATLPGDVLRSRKEQAIARLLAAVDLPKPLFNHAMQLEGRPYCADAVWLDILAVEVDGPAHDLARRNQRDKARDADFLVNGLPVLRLTTVRIERELDWCADRLTRAYAYWSSVAARLTQ